jgi:hypothetical protein
MTNPAEDHVIARAQIGEWAHLDKFTDKQIRAPFIRALLLGLPPEGHEKPIPLLAPGLRINGAHITEGPLVLTDCTAPSGGPLPGLSLENCVFHQDMDLSNAHLTKLS